MKAALKRIGLIFLGFLVALLLLETGLRIAGHIYRYEQVQTSEAGIHIEDENQYRILCIGESTTAESDFGGKTDAWPARLERILNHRTSEPRQYKVINEGVMGTVTAFVVARIRDQIKAYRPHLVVTMMGINDAFSSMKYTEETSSWVKMRFAELRVTKFFRVFFNAASHGFAKEEQPPPPQRPFVNEPGMVKSLNQKVADGDTAGAQAIVDKLLEKYPTKEKAIYAIFTRMLCKSTTMEQPVHQAFRMNVFNKMLALDVPRSDISGRIHAALTFQYFRNGQWNQYFEASRNAIRYLENENEKEYYISNYIHYSTLQKRTDPYVRKLEKKYRVSKVKGARYAATRHHYKMFYRILKKNNIKYAAMQYPTRDIRLLRYFLSDEFDPSIDNDAGMFFSQKADSKYDTVLRDDPDIVFIGHEAPFSLGLSSHPYDYYFKDRFGGTFGHTTAHGHELIAQTAADALLTSGILYR